MERFHVGSTQAWRRRAADARRIGTRVARWRPPPRRVRATSVGSGAALFVVGLLAFAYFQTQYLFRDHWREAIQAGLIPRNDGGILFGAVVAATGLAAVLAALSPLRPARRVGLCLVFVAGSAFLLFSHFTIFVNGIIIPNDNAASVEASFFFHESAETIPIATFILAMVTLLLLLGVTLAALAVIAPDLYRDHLSAPRDLGAQRGRVLLVTLALLAFGAGFLRTFFGFALQADSDPAGGFLSTNLLVVYYLLVITVAAALALAGWRAYSTLWGDLRDKSSQRFRRGYAYLVHTENWLWGIVLVLNGLVLSAGPVYQPPGNVDRVFAMNSKGVSMFFLLVFLVYAIQRRVSRQYLRFLRQERPALGVVRRDALWYLAALLAIGWTTIAALLAPVDLSPLTKLIVRYGFVALVLPLFAVRLDLGELVRPEFRFAGGPVVLLASALVSILVGIMLWGAGNSVVTVYSRAGGFVTPETSVLQPYATGLRILGSLFIATPLTLTLWFLALRFRRSVNPGPLIVVGLSIIVAMNLLFTINAQDVRDDELRASEVLIGFAIVGLSTTFDKVVVTILWGATATIGVLAMAVLLRRGVDGPASASTGRPAV